jgi:hypothetical protein
VWSVCTGLQKLRALCETLHAHGKACCEWCSLQYCCAVFCPCAHTHTEQAREILYKKRRDNTEAAYIIVYSVAHFALLCIALVLFACHAIDVFVQLAQLATPLVCCCAQSNVTATTATSRCVSVLPMRKQAQCSHTKLRAARSIVHSRFF